MFACAALAVMLTLPHWVGTTPNSQANFYSVGTDTTGSVAVSASLREIATSLNQYGARFVMVEAGEVESISVLISIAGTYTDLRAGIYNPAGTLLEQGSLYTEDAGWVTLHFDNKYSAADAEVFYVMVNADSDGDVNWFYVDESPPNLVHIAWHDTELWSAFPVASITVNNTYFERRFAAFITYKP